MLDQIHYERIKLLLPVLQHPDPRLAREFKEVAYFVRIPAGRDVFVEGDEPDSIALLISGAVRVYKIGETGREITLYRFGHGESCILTANAILSAQSFPAIATVDTDAEAVLVPAEYFRDWVQRYDAWREFVFNLLSNRLSSVMEIVDEVAFRRMDARVAALIQERGRFPGPIKITHQEIASELGSSREVISRILEDFASRGVLQLGRGSMEILDFEALANIAVM